MRIIHLSDLHLGKRVNEFSMIEDQKYILKKILQVIDEENAQAVIIAGDVYDKPIPSAEAVQLFDEFLVRLANRELKTFIISGNHDSAERIAFGGRLMNSKGVYVSPVYKKEITPIVLEDKYGAINFYMLPFIKPIHVRSFFEEEISTYSDAVRLAIEAMEVDKQERNIMITHQFVTGAETCDSEELSVGGSDNVDASLFDDFDYVALGHIHGPQKVSRDTIRYCGTPLKYSFSEANHVKSVTVLEMMEKGNLEIRTVPLIPLRDMKKIKGTYMELTLKSYYDSLNKEDYYHVTLTDEDDIPDAINKLRVIYKNIMKLEYDNTRTRNNHQIIGATHVEQKTPLELFSEFYYLQNSKELSLEQKELVEKFIESIWEGEK